MFRQKPIFNKFFVIVLTAFLFAGTSFSQTLNLKLIETSDVHGSLFQYDFIKAKLGNTSLAQLYTYIQQQRDNKDQSVVLLDDGDILQGQPIVYYYNFEKTDVPHIVSRVMNYMNYDAGTVGNHDIEPGHPVYDKIDKEFNFPWLAANAINTKTEKPYFKPYTIINRDGIKIAVLGMITPAIPNWLPKKIWSGIRFDDMVETAKKWVPIILKKEKPDLMVGLFHSGVEAGYNGADPNAPKNENASQLVAEKVPGFDIVFVGHDHHGWNYTIKNSEGKTVYILGTINAARTAAVANVILTKDPNTNKWEKKISGEIIESKDYKEYAPMVRKFAHDIEQCVSYVNKYIGSFTKSVSTKESMFGDSPFVDLIQKIQLELTKADVSFAAPLSFNAEIRMGGVRVRDMFSLYKYENLLYTMELTGQKIKNYLEYSFGNWFNQMKDENDHLLNFKTDDKGNLVEENGHPVLKSQYYNFSSAAGIKYTVDVSKPAGQRVTIISMSDGKPFDLNKKYKVAINSYRGNGGGGLLTKGAGIPHEKLADGVITSTQKDLRYYLMKWIQKHRHISPESLNNWKVIPEKWWKKGKERDFKLLYNENATTS
jgi:2',3'-cyclic-nucleotide 2'-phosphodiesterase/3'-nucleotidase